MAPGRSRTSLSLTTEVVVYSACLYPGSCIIALPLRLVISK